MMKPFKVPTNPSAPCSAECLIYTGDNSPASKGMSINDRFLQDLSSLSKILAAFEMFMQAS
jgi:hypothetical protein